MEGLSPAARAIIESFSSLEILNHYYLIGGTSLALQINHRLSEDLDFCQWIPRYHVTHAIPAIHILEELKKRFNHVEENRIDFHQVNYVVAEPPVRITFYQTALSKPRFNSIPLIGNIRMADLTVLGGSKMYVVTQRDALRDYYDLLVLLKEKHLTVKQMLEQAQAISSKTTPKALFDLFSNFSFDGNRFKLSDLEKLESRYNASAEDYVTFCRDVAKQILDLHPEVEEMAQSSGVQRSAEHLRFKIRNADKVLNDTIKNSMAKFGLATEEIEIMINIGPYASELEERNIPLERLTEIDLEDILHLRTGAIANLIYNLREKYSIRGKDFKRLKLTSDDTIFD